MTEQRYVSQQEIPRRTLWHLRDHDAETYVKHRLREEVVLGLLKEGVFDGEGHNVRLELDEEFNPVRMSHVHTCVAAISRPHEYRVTYDPVESLQPVVQTLVPTETLWERFKRNLVELAQEIPYDGPYPTDV